MNLRQIRVIYLHPIPVRIYEFFFLKSNMIQREHAHRISVAQSTFLQTCVYGAVNVKKAKKLKRLNFSVS